MWRIRHESGGIHLSDNVRGHAVLARPDDEAPRCQHDFSGELSIAVKIEEHRAAFLALDEAGEEVPAIAGAAELFHAHIEASVREQIQSQGLSALARPQQRVGVDAHGAPAYRRPIPCGVKAGLIKYQPSFNGYCGWCLLVSVGVGREQQQACEQDSASAPPKD